MLVGSTSKKVKQLGLHRLSTFGLLQPLRQSDVVMLMDFLIEQGYLKQIETTKFRPVVQISNTGLTLISGQRMVDLTTIMPATLVSVLSETFKEKKPHLVDDSLQSADDPNDNVREVAAASKPDNDRKPDNPVPRDSEQTNRTVEESQPAEHVDRREVATSASNSPTEALEKAAKIRIEPASSGAIKPSFYWTWRLLHEGYSPAELQQIRQIDYLTVLDHATRALEQGYAIPAEAMLPKNKVSRLQALIDSHGGCQLKDLLQNLPPEIMAAELIYFWKQSRSPTSVNP